MWMTIAVFLILFSLICFGWLMIRWSNHRKGL